MNPANVNFGNPNENPSNLEMPKQQVEEPEKKKEEKKDSFKPSVDEIFQFLNTKSTTILTFAMAIAIGYALKDFMNALDLNILQPCIMMLIMAIDKNNYLPITQNLREKEVAVDLPKFLGNMLILKLVIGSMYLVNKYSALLF